MAELCLGHDAAAVVVDFNLTRLLPVVLPLSRYLRGTALDCP